MLWKIVLMAAAPIFANCGDFYDGRNVFRQAARAAWEIGQIVFLYVLIYIFVFVFVHVSVYVFVFVFVSVFLYVSIYVFVYVFVYVFRYVFVCVCIGYVYFCMYLYLYFWLYLYLGLMFLASLPGLRGSVGNASGGNKQLMGTYWALPR